MKLSLALIFIKNYVGKLFYLFFYEKSQEILVHVNGWVIIIKIVKKITQKWLKN